MATQKKSKEVAEVPATNKTNVIKSLGWLLEVTFRLFAAWLLITEFTNMLATTAGFYALGTGLVIVCYHFVKAHK